MKFLSRRKFGALLGAILLSPLWRSNARADDGSHTHRVKITGFKFDPEILWIEQGDSVEWVNKDIAPHTATARDADWDTGELAKAERRVVAFSEAARFAYFCGYHPQMTGEIVVIRS